MEEEVPSGSDNIVTEFNTYEDFLDSQITSLDLYYLEVCLFCHSLSRTSNITMGAPTNLKSLFCLDDLVQIHSFRQVEIVLKLSFRRLSTFRQGRYTKNLER